MRLKSHSELHQVGLLNSLVGKIQKEVDFRNAHSIVPARATWRALRDTLTEEEWEKLDRMVAAGVILKYDGINYPSYEIDYTKLRAWEQEVKRYSLGG